MTSWLSVVESNAVFKAFFKGFLNINPSFDMSSSTLIGIADLDLCWGIHFKSWIQVVELYVATASLCFLKACHMFSRATSSSELSRDEPS